MDTTAEASTSSVFEELPHASVEASEHDGLSRPGAEAHSTSSTTDTCITVFPPVEDKVSLWARVAARQYAEDGEADGWDSDQDTRRQTVEDKYIAVCSISQEIAGKTGKAR